MSLFGNWDVVQLDCGHHIKKNEVKSIGYMMRDGTVHGFNCEDSHCGNGEGWSSFITSWRKSDWLGLKVALPCNDVVKLTDIASIVIHCEDSRHTIDVSKMLTAKCYDFGYNGGYNVQKVHTPVFRDKVDQVQVTPSGSHLLPCGHSVQNSYVKYIEANGTYCAHEMGTPFFHEIDTTGGKGRGKFKCHTKDNQLINEDYGDGFVQYTVLNEANGELEFPLMYRCHMESDHYV